MILDIIPESTRAAGLGVLMKGAGKLTRFIPIPQPTLLVGPGASARLGQAVVGFGHSLLDDAPAAPSTTVPVLLRPRVGGATDPTLPDFDLLNLPRPAATAPWWPTMSRTAPASR